MKKFIYSLLGLVLITGRLFGAACDPCCNPCDTGKTTLILRDHRHRAEVFTAFHELTPKTSECFKSKVQLTAFYHETDNGSKLGEIFGTCGKNCIKVGTATQVTDGSAHVENNFLLHNTSTPAENTLAGTLTFNPKHTAYGTNIEMWMGLDKIIKGLYFKENFIFMHVKNDLNFKVCSSATGAESPEAFTIADVLSGRSLIRKTTNPERNEQYPLCYAKICGAHDRTGLGNIESTLGWRFLDKKRYYVGVNLAWHTPSGDRPTAEYLWEPRLGSQHWALGGGLDAGFTLWSTKNTTLKLLAEFAYRYEFKETEKRTLGIKCLLTEDKYKNHVLSHYYLVSEAGKFNYLIPAANILTRNVDVTPGSQIDTWAALNYNWKGLTIDLGYNFFWKEKEKVCLKCNDWCDNKYGIAAFDYTVGVNDVFTIADHAQPAGSAINRANIDTSVAQTPEILSHKIFGSLGYIFKEWKCPLMLALGGAYEFGDGRAAADGYTLWVKGGFAF